MENFEICTSGDNLIHALEFIKKKKGSDGLMELVSVTGQGIDDIYPDMMYPFEMYIDLLKIIYQKFNSSDEEIISKLGYDRAKNLIVFEYLKDKSDPYSIFQLIERHWTRFNNFGKLKVKAQEANSIKIYLCEYPSNPLFCQRMKGFFVGTLTEVCCVKDVEVAERKCISKNGKYCMFNISWKEP